MKVISAPNQPCGIGVFGGTFDPIHLGHINAAQAAAKIANLQQVLLMPLGVAVHRQQPIASPKDRIQMCELAIAGLAGFEVDQREIIRGGASYTISTVRELREEMGRDVPIYWILGADAAQEFTSWRNWQGILAQVNLLVIARGGYALKAALPRKLQTLCSHQFATHGKVLLAHIEPLATSSSQIRQAFISGDMAYLNKSLRQNVREYAFAHGIYSPNQKP